MSRFFSEKYTSLVAYTPGEQPRGREYIKLNTNESPYPPSAGVLTAVAAESDRLQLYSDPACGALVSAVAELYGVEPSEILMTNGSDEILNFAFMAFGDKTHPFVFPDITYGFYSVFADLYGIPYETIPLKEDFTIDINDYIDRHAHIVIANPNAPTGLALSVAEIEKIVASNPNRIVIIDEAYVDFGAESCVPLTHRYDNLLVTQTFSKSRSMAGARLGFGIGNKAIIADLSMIKYSTNPYNVNRMTMAAGIVALRDNDYYMRNCRSIEKTRDNTKRELERLGFTATDSLANFLFVKTPRIGGEALYRKLKEKGVLIRHFSAPRIRDYNRITVGTPEEMEILLCRIGEILNEEEHS